MAAYRNRHIIFGITVIPICALLYFKIPTEESIQDLNHQLSKRYNNNRYQNIGKNNNKINQIIKESMKEDSSLNPIIDKMIYRKKDNKRKFIEYDDDGKANISNVPMNHNKTK